MPNGIMDISINAPIKPEGGGELGHLWGIWFF